MRLVWLICVFMLFGCPGANAAELVDHFNNPTADEKVWDFCQADPKLIGYGVEPGSGRTYMVLRIDDKREDVEICTSASERNAIDEWDALGPKLLSDLPDVNEILPGRRCVSAELRNGKPIVQRNELRFASPALYPPVENDTWYFITFRLKGYDGDRIPECGSARWVVGQWKYEHIAPNADGSPFLAQRFDNGVLHVTMDDGGCRCMIAKAGGDPDLMRLRQKLVPLAQNQLTDALPLECRSSSGTGADVRCMPAHLMLKARDMEDLSTLPDPKGDWVEMAYHIRAGGPEGARIDVYANGRFIVRAEGDIDPHLPGNRVKFKIGHYRDKIPVKAELLLNDLCVSRRLATCVLSSKP